MGQRTLLGTFRERCMLHSGIAPIESKEGDHILHLRSNAHRKWAIGVMALNRCKSIRFIENDNGTVHCHGYLEIMQFNVAAQQSSQIHLNV